LKNFIFNKSWLEIYTYKEGLFPDEDLNQACCALCRRSFAVKYDGKDASNKHTKTERHKKVVGV